MGYLSARLEFSVLMMATVSDTGLAYYRLPFM